ncbi:MAG TPA: hypothetical protein VFO49_15145 [Nocardioides sp.]|nr:hypothetical protein [Nocardioides sp.]
MDVREVRRELFGFLQSAETQWKFFARVVDDVDWTVQGTHPLAGRYHEKQQFLDATFVGPLEKGAVARVER